ncbi:type I restriction enzyme endonuclease domain-containing protein [Tritonibacter mobilis]|uniref:Uncharacterized protein n=1 Tax=Tritonibacter mobilis F1926 TaxID=1265309 RepID=A0A1B1A7N3_9RHOB|nr:type I restriction enzyme endonuclease domain-containing protein [Tritonibacter mobilis]ANP42556.1 hypothetical protein K529_017445 [Tritonibacter mobilis F1926]KJZ21960.1 hypothetical protein TW79_20590 [Tritonibacter mobilis]
MRGGLEPSEYKHVALGLIFLKYISEAFQAMHDQLAQDEFADPEDPEEYLAENVFWVPETARWSHIQQNARSENIGKIIDDAMEAIEAEPTNETLKGVLPKNYARPTLDKTMLGELVDLFSNIKMHDSAEGKRGGEFFTPRSVVRKARQQRNVVEAKAFSERLQAAVARYHANAITSLEMIQELIDMAKDMKASADRGDDLGLNEEELAFYDALAQNQSALEVLGNDELRQIAHVLVEQLQKNVTVDWQRKESARAKLRVLVRRILKKYGYPPDLAPAAISLVLSQAETLLSWQAPQ